MKLPTLALAVSCVLASCARLVPAAAAGVASAAIPDLPGDDAPAPAECTINGKKFGGITYLTGSYLRPGSIFAECNAGAVKCFEDDGALDKRAMKSVACSQATRQRQLGVSVPAASTWPGDVVCYKFAAAVTPAQRTMFAGAFKEYKDRVGITFVDVSTCAAQFGTKNPKICGGCKQAVQIKNNEDGCWAHVGYYPPGTVRQLNVGAGCHYHYIYLHELGHVVGLWHEHSHKKRKVVVLRDNLLVPAHNYMKVTDGMTTKYDLNSIMHYDGDEFCIPKKLKSVVRYCDVHERFKAFKSWCTVPTEAHCDRSKQSLIGGARKLAGSDIAHIRKLYGIADTPAVAPAKP